MPQLSVPNSVSPKGVNAVNFCAKKKSDKFEDISTKDNNTSNIAKFSVYATAITAVTIAAITLAKKGKVKENLTKVVSDANAKSGAETIKEAASKAENKTNVEKVEEVISKPDPKAVAEQIETVPDANKNFEKTEILSVQKENKRGSYTDEVRKRYEDAIRKENEISGRSMSELEIEDRAATRFFEDIIENNRAKLQKGEITFTDILYEHGSSEFIQAHAEAVNAFKAEVDLPEEFISDAVSSYMLKFPDINCSKPNYTYRSSIIEPFKDLNNRESIINAIEREINGKDLDLKDHATINYILMNPKKYLENSKLLDLFEHYRKSSKSDIEAMEKCYDFQKNFYNFDYSSYADKFANKEEFEKGLCKILNKMIEESDSIKGVYFISDNQPVKIIFGTGHKVTFQPTGSYWDDFKKLKDEIRHLIPKGEGDGSAFPPFAPPNRVPI